MIPSQIANKVHRFKQITKQRKVNVQLFQTAKSA